MDFTCRIASDYKLLEYIYCIFQAVAKAIKIKIKIIKIKKPS
jgi:hypothetical protein